MIQAQECQTKHMGGSRGCGRRPSIRNFLHLEIPFEWPVISILILTNGASLAPFRAYWLVVFPVAYFVYVFDWPHSCVAPE